MMGLWAVFLYFHSYFFYGCHDLIVQKLVEEKMDCFILAHSCSFLKAYNTLESISPGVAVLPSLRHVQKASLPYLLLSCWRLNRQSQKAGIKYHCMHFNLETSQAEFMCAQQQCVSCLQDSKLEPVADHRQPIAGSELQVVDSVWNDQGLPMNTSTDNTQNSVLPGHSARFWGYPDA